MRTISAIREMQNVSEGFRSEGKRIAVVPTMGFLHDGHLSLIRIARNHADVVITTLFVNPTQFAPHEDFSRYPRNLERDRTMAANAGTDVLFAPDSNQMYPENYLTYVEVETLGKLLEGASRPSHFRGVTTVVAKLFNITNPHVAVFGQKDAQQVVVIKKMVKDLNFDIEIVVGPIVRESDGLALSSRNTYLTPAERRDAVVLYEALLLAREMIRKGERNGRSIVHQLATTITAKPTTRVDYIAVTDPETLEAVDFLRPNSTVLVSLAVYVGTTRLIDNMLIGVP